MNSSPATAPPCPIPRTGLRGSAGPILYGLLTLALTTVGVGIASLGDESKLLITAAEILSGVSLVLLSLHLWRVTRRMRGVVPILLLVAFLIGSVSEGILGEVTLVPSAIFISLIFAVSEGSIVVAVLPARALYGLPLIPLVGYGLTAVLTADPLGAITVLLPVPAAVALALGTRNSAAREDGLTRVGVICLTSLFLGLSIAAVGALLLYRALGSLSTEVLSDAFTTFRTAFSGWIVPDWAADQLKPEDITYLTDSYMNLLPGYLVVAVNLLATATQLTQQAALVSFGFGESVTDRVREFRMSFLSCIVFSVCFLVALFASGESSTLIGTVADNIYLVLMPGLAFAGMLRLMGSMTRRGPGGMGCGAFLVFLIPVVFLLAPAVLAISEVFGHAAALIASRRKPPMDDDPFGSSSGDHS